MEHLIEIDGYSLFIKCEGIGEPLVMLHSYWGNLRLFDELVAHFQSDFCIVRVDLPGHGQSSNPPHGHTFERFAVALHEALKQIGIGQKINLMGHSMGGYCAMAYACAYPDSVGRLILMHAPMRAADAASIKLRNREAILLKKGKKDLLMQAMLPSNFANESLAKLPDKLNLLSLSSELVSIDGALLSIEAINNRKNYLESLKKVSFPILIVIGRHDRVYSACDQLEEASQLPNAKVLLLEQSGHMGFFEEPELVVNRLTSFLSVFSTRDIF